MQMPSADARKSLASLVELYHGQIAGPAISYLTSRGITREAADRFQLGYTGNTGDYRAGRLAIPYLTPAGPWHIKYRCIIDHACDAFGHDKYVYDTGTGQHLFNASATIDAAVVVIVEGEIDAISGSMCGVPHVGYPGAQTWRGKKAWRWVFDSADEVIVVADGDEPDEGEKMGVGEKAAREVTESLQKANPDALVRMVVMPVGYDANKFIREYGQTEYLNLIGVSGGQ